MFGATAILALSCGAATSQTTGDSQFLNNQIQLGDIVAGQTLDVVETSETVSAVTTATGNAASGGSHKLDLRATSYQEQQGAVTAHGVVNASGQLGKTGAITTAATGNTGDASITGATLSGTFTQVTGPTSIVARGQLEGEEAVVVDMNQSTQAVANSQGLLLSNGALGARASQWNQASVLADGGAIVGSVTGTMTVSANAAGNNLTSDGFNQSSQRIIATQGNQGELVQGSKFTAYGDSYVTSTAAMATGNNISATNDGPLLDLTSNQTNTAYLRAQAEGTSAAYSSHDVSAFAAGNSTLAGTFGAEIVVDNTQFNGGGGVEAIAVSDVGSGWDSSASATAHGNAVTGYVCSTCTGKMTVRNNQTNDVDVAATATARTQSGRSVVGLANAVGNSASFYVSAPSSGAGGAN